MRGGSLELRLGDAHLSAQFSGENVTGCLEGMVIIRASVSRQATLHNLHSNPNIGQRIQHGPQGSGVFQKNEPTTIINFPSDTLRVLENHSDYGAIKYRLAVLEQVED